MSGPVLACSKGWLVGFPIGGLFLRRRQDVLKLRKVALTAILLMGVVVVPALAQGPLHKRINFTINVPFELKKAGAVLPPGNYVLYQISQNDPQMFALYQGDMTHAPIAMIRTTRVLASEVSDARRLHYPWRRRLGNDRRGSKQEALKRASKISCSIA
jgi:hypothetical protein